MNHNQEYRWQFGLFMFNFFILFVGSISTIVLTIDGCIRNNINEYISGFLIHIIVSFLFLIMKKKFQEFLQSQSSNEPLLEQEILI